jgi:KaiC/GvpD/RAD55 family RecA-like ATPase
MKEINLMDMYCLYENKEWLEQHGLISNRQLTITVLLAFVQAAIQMKAPSSKHKRANKLIQKLKKLKVDFFDGSMVVEKGERGEKNFFFKSEYGTKYLLKPIREDIGAVDYNFPDILLLGFRAAEKKGGKKTDEMQLCPVVIYQKRRVRKPGKLCDGPIPVGVPGLAELLFPNLPEDQRGFQKPSEDRVVPRLIVIKGAVGTGKTTLATQMMIRMAQEGYCCDYWCSTDRPQAIKNTALSFKFCTESEYEELRSDSRISVLEVGDKYLRYLQLPEQRDPISSIVARKGLERTYSAMAELDVLFLDSLNLSQIRDDVDREDLWRIFNSYRKISVLSIFLLEDYGEDGTETVRQLISDCEFLADVVIELSDEPREGYHAKSIKVKKKHYGEQVYGSHFYKICAVEGSLPNMNIKADKTSKHSNTGIVVYPSIHRYLSRARIQETDIFSVNTGITHLDAMLSGGSKKRRNIDSGCIESNSCIVISGERGGHKLPLGLNILMGGMWKIESGKSTKKVVADKDVLMILLDEEADIHIDLSATARDTHLFTDVKTKFGSLDSGKWIRWKKKNHRDHNRGQQCSWSELFGKGMNVGKKVHFNLWCASILNDKGKTTDCRKFVIAGFRPGCITPEEFIYIVDSLLKPPGTNDRPFSRVLFVSTAQLFTRFPLLGRSRLFIPALVDLFKSHNVVSIFIDVRGTGYDEKVSYGLLALADYILRVDEFSHSAGYDIQYTKKLNEDEKKRITELLSKDSDRYVWSRLHMENVRGKEYSRPCHALTARPRPDGVGNNLYIVNARERQPTPLNFPSV